MKIIHFSDPHAGGPIEEFGACFDKRLLGVCNYIFQRRRYHDLSILERAVEYILKTRPDVAVCTGDLTSAGQPGEFAQVLKILEPLKNSDIPLIYTPGNHDCYVDQPKCVAAMQQAVAELSQGKYFFDDMPCRLDIAGVEFLVVNTGAPSNLLCSWGFLQERERNFISGQCAGEHKSPRIMITHYPITGEVQFFRFWHRLFGKKKVLELLRAGTLDLVLCGHVHQPYLHTDGNGRGECCAGSVSRAASMVEIECDPERRVFSYRMIKL